ncbi:hypothetical protein Tco_0093885, partial [Tanacetum coccineum]
SGTARKRGQREGKAPMVEEDIQATHKTKEQIRQEEAGLEEAIRLQTLQEEEATRQVYLDALLAKRISEEEELSEQQKKRKAEVQEASQNYTEEDWDTIRAKLEANTEVKSTDKGKRYRRRARSVAKKINTGLDVEEEINTGIEDVNTGSTKVDSGTASKRGQREGKAPMVEKDIQATHKTKEQIR